MVDIGCSLKSQDAKVLAGLGPAKAAGLERPLQPALPQESLPPGSGQETEQARAAARVVRSWLLAPQSALPQREPRPGWMKAPAY
jgi:hypothetical protein